MASIGLRALRCSPSVSTTFQPLLARSLLAPFSRQLSTKSEDLTLEGLAKGRQVSVDRELPDPFADKKQNKIYFWVYGVGVVVLCALIFNYEKTRSPIVNSVLYCLRRSDLAKASLGPNIGFSSSYPWIWGPLNTVQSNIDITFNVRGEKNSGTLKLKASRTSKLVPFDIHHWTLVVKDGPTIDLLQDSSVDFEL